jgi:hypothetical protein
VPGRNWDQLIRFYHTFLKVQGSYIWSAYMEDPQAIEEMLKIPQSEWSKAGPPPLFGWSNVIDKLTDLGDQMIAQRATDKKVRFYPRPRIPAIEMRKKLSNQSRDDAIEASRRRNRERRGI